MYHVSVLNDFGKGARILLFLSITALEYEDIKETSKENITRDEMNLEHMFLVYADDVSFRVENVVVHTYNKGHIVLLTTGKEEGLAVNEEKAKHTFRCQNAVQNINIDKLRKCSNFHPSG
jgi:predicted DNA-binding transcriptional regulator YafY